MLLINYGDFSGLTVQLDMSRFYGLFHDSNRFILYIYIKRRNGERYFEYLFYLFIRVR